MDLRDYQEDFVSSHSGVKAISAGRRAGTTTALIADLCAKAMRLPGASLCYVSPYNHFEVAPLVRELLSDYIEMVVGRKFVLKNGSQLKLSLGANEATPLLVEHLAIDNAAFLGWSDVIRQQYSRSMSGEATLTVGSTPKITENGEDPGWFYYLTLFSRGSADFDMFYWPSSISPYWTEQMGKDMRRELSRDSYITEVLGAFTSEVI